MPDVVGSPVRRRLRFVPRANRRSTRIGCRNLPASPDERFVPRTDRPPEGGGTGRRRRPFDDWHGRRTTTPGRTLAPHRSRELLELGEDSFAELAGDADHAIRSLRRAADPEAGVTPGEDLL